MTICAFKKMLLFTEAAIKTIVDNAWNNIPNLFHRTKLDQYVIMPNHFHGIIHIIEEDFAHKSVNDPAYNKIKRSVINKRRERSEPHLGAIIQYFKSITTVDYLNKVCSYNKMFPGKLWQRNYYEHVIRNQKELESIKEYIENNPINWEIDPENPINSW